MLSALTYHRGDVIPLQSGQPQVPNLDQASGAIDKDIVTLEVSVNNGWLPGVEEMEPPQDLPPPATNHLGLYGLESPHVTVDSGNEQL